MTKVDNYTDLLNEIGILRSQNEIMLDAIRRFSGEGMPENIRRLAIAVLIAVEVPKMV